MRPWYEFCLRAAASILWLLGYPRVVGREHLPRDRGFILASNHFSFLEAPVLAVASWQEVAFLAKLQLFRIPVLGRLIASLNAIPINRGSTDVSGLNAAAALLRSGRSLIVFPEGGRNKTGRLREAKGGIGYLVLESGVPVVPAYVRNTDHILKCALRKAKITVAFGPPLEPDPELLKLERKEAHRRVGRTVMAHIARLEQQVLALEAGRGGPRPEANSAPGRVPPG
ncbi:MAG TPA: lysophospholipid acyltransferase family protein [Candidatus Saccharimonadales bacterium]|nr:lysophospholipid acyltransferase family protein [Candidatus Saccharimonadales bacterium]